jgi:uracil-DNA glycosylase family 4
MTEPIDKVGAFKQIEKELLALTQSPLYEYRSSNGYFPVVGEGSLDASIMFVGEAPGENEAKSARPFCGRSGKFLDEMLASIGLNRADVYITNLVKDRPQDNRDPDPAEIALYAPFLDRQIDIIQPKVIVTLGRISMKYLLNHLGCGEHFTTIAKMHGQVYEGKASYGPVSIATLYHPASALYNGGMRMQHLEDFKVLRRFIQKA